MYRYIYCDVSNWNIWIWAANSKNWLNIIYIIQLFLQGCGCTMSKFKVQTFSCWRLQGSVQESSSEKRKEMFYFTWTIFFTIWHIINRLARYVAGFIYFTNFWTKIICFKKALMIIGPTRTLQMARDVKSCQAF